WFVASDDEAFADFVGACERHIGSIHERTWRMVEDHPALGPLFAERPPQPRAVEGVLSQLRQGLMGDWKPYEDTLAETGRALARLEVPMRVWAELGAEIGRSLIPILFDEYGTH